MTADAEERPGRPERPARLAGPVETERVAVAGVGRLRNELGGVVDTLAAACTPEREAQRRDASAE